MNEKIDDGGSAFPVSTANIPGPRACGFCERVTYLQPEGACLSCYIKGRVSAVATNPEYIPSKPGVEASSRYGVDAPYLIREISALVGTIENREGASIARYLRRLADVADAAVGAAAPAPSPKEAR